MIEINSEAKNKYSLINEDDFSNFLSSIIIESENDTVYFL